MNYPLKYALVCIWENKILSHLDGHMEATENKLVLP